jgi:hypothetical protein
MQFIKNLHYKYSPNQQIGTQWVPDPNSTVLQKSRGLIALIAHDGLSAGTAFNAGTITALDLNDSTSLRYEYHNTSTEKIMRRNPPENISVMYDDIVDTLTHEFGHSFNLNDEYENFIEDKWESLDFADNIASLYTIKLNDDFRDNRLIDMDMVKWFELLRIKLSSVLTEDSLEDAGRYKVKIDSRYGGRWKEAKDQNKKARLRKLMITREGVQLPLHNTPLHYVYDLDIIDVDEVNGYIILGGSDLPALPLPVMTKGSTLFIPLKNDEDELMYVVEKKVLNFLKNNATNKNLPLNKNSDTTRINNDEDNPKDIPDFKAPCKSYKLIGIYEGANTYTGMQYRPAGACKMRGNHTSGEAGEFCFVCKYLIVNRVDPGLHDILDHNYYPTAKKNWDSQFMH